MDDLKSRSEVLTVEETAKFLKICRVNAYQLFHKEGFPCFKIGRSLRICKDDLLEWLKFNLNTTLN